MGANAKTAYPGGGRASKVPICLPPGFTRPPVWELAKRDGLLIAGEREFKGARFFELRLWASDGAKPTAKGVTMPVEAVAALARALTVYAATLPVGGPDSDG